jgi:hypothetical protein
MNIDGTNNSAMGTSANSLLLQKFLNGDTDLRSVEQRDLRVCVSHFFSFKSFLMIVFILASFN